MTFRLIVRSVLGLTAVGAALWMLAGNPPALAAAQSTPGALMRVVKDREPVPCPLRHTDVKAEISGFISRVTVTQEFENTLGEKIEAVYAFPLPPKSAVDDMTMYIGSRTVRGKIKRREEARRIYEAARARGQLAGLLDQERPNIFTQSVANIPPGAKVKVVISYVETLKYEDGSYEFSFPMVVGPRYMPGGPAGRTGGGWSPDTSRVPDASRISPPVAPPGARAGHDISIEVKLDAGLPIDALNATTHEVVTERPGPRQAIVRLKNKTEIPNKDFVLRYDVAGGAIQDAILTHRASASGFFTLILQPPERVRPEEITPKEIVFVIDTSGSMSGFPIEKAKEVVDLSLKGLHPRDTFNLITFSGDTVILFPEPVPATAENVEQARLFLASRQGRGGTEMMKAIRAALDPSDRQGHIRVVCFLTDGYVGNDMEIVGEIKRHPNARVFSFGIGGSVNRFLLDKMAEEGRGEVEYVSLRDDGSAAARRFHERVRTPVLTDIAIEWGGLPVAQVYPERIPDMFSAKPVVVVGRYTGAARGAIRLKGRTASGVFIREVPVTLPERESRHDTLASLWARTRIDDLMAGDWAGMQRGAPQEAIKAEITQLGLDYRLMTQFTSFVAVEETVVSEGGQPRRIEVPVEMPEGVSYEGVFGESDRMEHRAFAPATLRHSIAGGAVGGVIAGARPGGFAGGAHDQVVFFPPPPLVRAEAVRPRENEPASRIHADVQALIDRLARTGGHLPASHGIAFVRDGRVHLRLTLTDSSAATLEALKRAGFVVAAREGPSTVTGAVTLDRLEPLCRLTQVARVAPL
jgi:Ca-activated chloride channel family protein